MDHAQRSRLTRRDVVKASLAAGIATTVPTIGRAGWATPATPPALVAGTEILWDTWGVPHVFAPDAPGLFRAFGWAQAHAHGDLLLRLYAQARGRGAEYLGEAFLVSDRAVRTMDLAGHAARWYREQTPAFLANLDAFADGINAYAEAHPQALDERMRAVLPVAGGDVVAHTTRILYLFLASVSNTGQALPGGAMAGSNGWAIAPPRAEDGHPLLLVNPHNPWGGEYTWFEAQLSAPGVYDAYGATFVGVPVLALAFNDRLGWANTVNTIDPGDLYALTLAEGGYRFDGEARPFETRTETIRIRQDDGTLREEPLEVRRSVHGPVVEEAGEAIAIRLAGFVGNTGLGGALQQWWDMGRARNLAEFEAAVSRLRVPMFTMIYADADGHIMSLFNGQVPKRPAGDVDWSGPVPGDTSATLWTEVHPYEDLPKVVDPPGGWVQNSNSPPWYTTYPIALDARDFPPDLAPGWLLWRERRAIRMLEENPRLSLERLVALKHSTRSELADRVLDDLLGAARRSGEPTADRAARVLDAWDREANPGSTGALLFLAWLEAAGPTDPTAAFDALVARSTFFATPFDPSRPLDTPAGLADPESAVQALVAAAQQIEAVHGRLDVPWGDVARLRRGNVDLPANGFPGDPFGVFRTFFVDVSRLGEGEPLPVVFGDSYVAAVEFGEGVRAKVLLTYGNASQPGSPHNGDQLVLAARGELRPAWLSREEIEANLERRETLG